MPRIFTLSLIAAMAILPVTATAQSITTYTASQPVQAETYEYPLAKTYASREEALADVRIEIFDTPIPAAQSHTYSAGTTTYGASSYGTNAYGASTINAGTVSSATNTYTYSEPMSNLSTIIAPATSRNHVVASGETLYGIGRRYGLKPSELMNANGLNGSNIQPGQILAIPSATHNYAQTVQRYETPINTGTTQVIRNVTPIPGNVHAVLPGDTLYSLARRYCTSASAIAFSSGISTTSILQPGQQLTLPAGHCQQ